MKFQNYVISGLWNFESTEVENVEISELWNFSNQKVQELKFYKLIGIQKESNIFEIFESWKIQIFKNFRFI